MCFKNFTQIILNLEKIQVLHNSSNKPQYLTLNQCRLLIR